MSNATTAEDQLQLSVNRQDQTLVVSGGSLAENAAQWHAQAIDEHRILLAEVDAGGKAPSIADSQGWANCPVDLFPEFLLGLHRAGYDGMVVVDTGFGAKRVYFRRGHIVFAGSSIMDDRLGEVIFREARITIDQLTDAAAQVTKVRKFGQVLLASGVFSNVQLWQALQLQVRQILRSLFMAEKVFFELHPGTGMAPTEIVFTESMTELITDCGAYGSAFRAFLSRLSTETSVVLTVSRVDAEQYPQLMPGTFVGDLIALVEQQNNIQDLLNASKLIDPYTVAALFNMINMGLCRLAPDVDDGKKPALALGSLKSKIDTYSYVLQGVQKAFREANRPFPLTDLQTFASTLNPEGFTSVFVDIEGQLAKESQKSIFNQCASDTRRSEYFSVRIDSMVQFLLQLAGDNLDFKVAKAIRQDFHSITA